MANVFISSVLDAPIDRVWAVIRDFNGLPTWNPAVIESEIEGGRPADSVGCVRAFQLADGGFLREQLLAFSDLDHTCTYNILESPMPLTGYTATLRALPVTDGGRTYVEWTASFDCADADRDELVNGIGNDVFQASFDRLKELLAE